MRVADGAQGRVLVEVVRHVREEDLVDDDGSDHEAHHRAEGEHVADRRRRVPVGPLARDELRPRQHEDVLGQERAQPVAHPLRRDASVELHESEVDPIARAGGEEAQEVRVAGQEARVEPEGGAHLEEADHADLAVVHLGPDDLPGANVLGHRPVLGPRARVEEHGVLPAEGRALLGHPRRVEHVVVRVDAHGEDAAPLVVPGVLPDGGEDVDRGDRGHALDRQGLVEALDREGRGAHDELAVAAEEGHAVAEALVVADGALEERRPEAELHQDQEHCEGDPRRRDQEPERAVAQLEPAEGRGSPGHARIRARSRRRPGGS
jgi:hypothetical protein